MFLNTEHIDKRSMDIGDINNTANKKHVQHTQSPHSYTLYMFSHWLKNTFHDKSYHLGTPFWDLYLFVLLSEFVLCF